MKKFRQLPAIILAVILSLSLVFGVAACGETYTVTFESNGGSAVDAMVVPAKGATLPSPTQEGLTFAGWFETADCTGSPVSNTYKPTKDITLYAKWTSNKSGWEDAKVYTDKGYAIAIPSLWNELKSTDGGDRDIMDYLGSSFFEFDFEFDDNGEIVEGGFKVVPSAATKLEDVTESYKGKYGIAEDDTVGHRAWRYTLRNDLKWDDGTPIVAGDFVYTMEKQLNGKYLFDQAANQWNGNYVLHNSQNYFYKNRYGQVSIITMEGDDPVGYVDYDAMKESDGVLQYEGKDILIKVNSGNMWGSYGLNTYFGAGYFGWDFPEDENEAPTVNALGEAWQAIAAKADNSGYVKLSKADVETIREIIAVLQEDGTLAAYEERAEEYAFLEWQEFCFFGYVFPDVSFDEVGIFAESDTQLVVVYDNANLAPIDENGDLTYEAAYYFQSLPLVKKDLWEKTEIEPTTGSTVYDTNYNAVSVANSASWGPYKLTNYQAATTYTLSRNENWYGYGMEQYDGKFQTDAIEVRQVPDWNTAWQAFQKGELNAIGIDVTIANEYRNSSRAYYTPTSGVSTYFLQSNESALTKERGNALLKYKDFRQAFSLALNRQDYCQRLTTSSVPSLGIYNELIYYDVAHAGVYRHDVAAKEVLLTTYGAEKQPNGNWKVGTVEYDTVDKALDALTGYNLTLAKEKFTSAYNAALEAGDIDATGKVTIRYGASQQTESVTREINFLNELFATATEGTPLEGRVEVVYFAFDDADWIDQFRTGGEYDIANAYVQGGAWNPYYSLQIYVLDSQRLTLGWDTSAEMIEITVPAGGENQPEIHDTLSIVEWFYCLNGLGGKYNIALYPTSSRLVVTAALEGAVLQSYTTIPVFSITSSSLLSHRAEFITYEYNTFMAFGGIQYMTYKYDDIEWAAYVASQGGIIDYRQ